MSCYGPAMARAQVLAFDPLLSEADAGAMVDLCERFGTYGMYSEEPTFPGLIGEGLPARWDAVRNFIKTGGRFGQRESLERLAARTNYFRETYAYGTRPHIDGIEPFLHHEGFVEAARALHGRPLVAPAIVFANLIVPGQELAIHTDVPEFRGVNRTRHPQWLIVAMHHSGLFAEHHMPIATGVAWFHDCEGGEFAYYPAGADGPPETHCVRANTSLLLDTDSVFHGVDPVASRAAAGEPPALLRPGMQLRFLGERRWGVFDGDRQVVVHRWEELRFSISWKAYCFRDEAERRAWFEHSDDLDVGAVVDRLVEDLRARGRLDARPADAELVEHIIDEYIRFPAPAAAAA
jgi:hypothetical protein